QVSGTFFTDVTDEDHPAAGPHAAFSERLRDGQHDGESPAIVADPRSIETVAILRDLHVRALGKDGVEVAGDRHGGAGPGARALRDDVTDGVDARICVTERSQAPSELGAAHLLLEARRWNL